MSDGVTEFFDGAGHPRQPGAFDGAGHPRQPGAFDGAGHPRQPGAFDGAGHPRQPASTAAIVQHGLDASRQSLFDAADVPLARTDELLAAVVGPAVKAVLAARIEQIVKYGHASDRDDHVGARVLASNARTMILEGIDVAGGPNRNLVVARRRFARGAAMMLAAIDALDRAVARAERETEESDGA